MEKIREHCRHVLYTKLKTTLDNNNVVYNKHLHAKKYTNKELAFIVTNEIDKGIVNYIIKQGYKKFDEQIYKTRMRQLMFNLIPNKSVDNKTLLPKVLSKEITISHLCEHMTAEEMCPEKYIESRQEIEIEMQKKYNLTDYNKQPDGAVQCRKCKSWKTVYNEYVYSGDEITVKFAYCYKCFFRWKFY